MTVIRQEDFISSVAGALQYISYYHPVDYITSLAKAYEREQSPAAKDAIAQILINSRMCAEGHRPICQDTGIVSVSGLSSNTTTTPPADSQLAPPGSLTRPSLSPSAGVLASIGRTFLGLNHPKTHQRMPLFHHSLQRQPHRPFQAYPAKCPAHRGTSVDKIVSTASGAGNSSARVAPANRTALAAFLKAAD